MKKLFSRKKKRIAQLKEVFGQVKKDEFHFDLIEIYHCNKKHSGKSYIISDQIWNDLDMSLFFAHIDYTSSTVGQQYLYDQLRKINYNSQAFSLREKVLSDLEQHPEDLYEIQYLLEKLNNRKSYYLPNLFQGIHIERPKWFFIIPVLSVTVFISFILSFFNPSFLFLIILLLPVNVALHYYNKLNVNVYIDSVPMLLQLNAAAKKIMTFKQFSPLSGNTEKSVEAIDQIRRRIAIFKLEQKVESEMEMAFWFLLELIKITFLLEPWLLFSIIGKLKTKRAEIEKVFTFVGEADTALSIISLRKASSQYCIPAIIEKGSTVAATEMVHPLVHNCVANSFETSSKSFLLTGSNMSGKTTFIRAVGLNIISGFCLNTCFAKTFSFPVLKIHTSIRISDDISSASSYFFKEVAVIKQIITDTALNSINIVLLDELFKGTNTIERIASAKSVLSFLHQHHCLVFVSTHDLELTGMLKEEYELFHFEESVTDGKIIFDYQLKKGIPASGNAIEILKLNEFPSEITEEATEIALKMSRRNKLKE